MREYKSGARIGYGSSMTEELVGLSDADLQDLAYFLAQPADALMLTSFALLLVLFWHPGALLLLVFVLPVRILAYAYRKIGVRPRYMFLVLLLTLVGSFVNIPLFSLGSLVVAINVGGALVPLLCRSTSSCTCACAAGCSIGTAIVAAIVHSLAQIVPGRASRCRGWCRPWPPPASVSSCRSARRRRSRTSPGRWAR